MNANPIDPIETLSLNSIKNTDFESLLSGANDAAPVVTLLMPMEKKGQETRKNHITFKNALSEAKLKLTDKQLNHDPIGKALKGLESLDEEGLNFWQQQQEGFAMTVSGNGEISAFKTPFPLKNHVEIGDHPQLGCLLPLTEKTFSYVLVLDLNKLRLFKVDRWCVEEIELKNVPTSLEEAMKYDDPEKTLQHHTSGSSQGSSGRLKAIHHGQGSGGEENQLPKLRRYFEQVNRGLADCFEEHSETLVLFGPDSEIGHFRKVCAYPNLWEEDIRHNPSSLSEDELEEKLLEWGKKIADLESRRALSTLDAHIAQGLGETGFESVVKAAQEGRVETLFVKKDAVKYGEIDDETHRVSIADSTSHGAIELVSATVRATLSASGYIRFVDGDEMPEGADLAAILRY